MATTTRPLTADELLQLPDDGNRHELVKGALRTVAPPGYGHGRKAVRLSRRLDEHVEAHGLGDVLVEAGYRLSRDPDTVRGPDISFVASNRIPPHDQQSQYFEGAPDLAIEIVSPSDSAVEVLEKVQEYLAAGTRLVWVLYSTTSTIMVYRADGSVQLLKGGDSLSGEDVVPGFEMRVDVVFE